jgi:hypothetical protein
LVEQLQGKFESTDYGATTGSPIERLAHMNKDVNAIVVERERIAKEKEKAEDAIWWEHENAGVHSPKKKENLVKPKDMPEISPAFARSSTSKSDVKQSEVKDNLTRKHGDHDKLNRPVGDFGIEKVPVKSKEKDEHQSNDSVMGRPSKSGWNGVMPGHQDLSKEKASLDANKEERRHMWDGYPSLKEDPANYRLGELDAFRMSVTDTLPRGNVVRSKDSASSAFSPIAAAHEDSDQSRTHTRVGRNRVMELGKDEAMLTQQDFRDNINIGRQEQRSFQAPNQSVPHDFLESAGGFFASGGDSRKDISQDQNARTWTEGSMKNRLVLPTYLPPDQRLKDDTRTVKAESTGWFGGIRQRAHDAKETVEDKLDSAKDSVKDSLDSAKDSVISAKDSVKDSLDSAKDTVEEKFDAAKVKIVEWKDDAKHALGGAKDTIVDKTDEFTTILRKKKDDAAESIDRAEDKMKLKGRELKDDISLQANRIESKGSEWKDAAKLKGREIKEDIKEKSSDIRDKSHELKEDAKIRTKEWKGHVSEHARIKERELKQDAHETKIEMKHGASKIKDKASDLIHDAEDEAKHLVENVNSSWWNPLSHLRGDIKERHLEVDASPEGVHLIPVDEKTGITKQNGSIGRSGSPTMKLGVSGEPIYVPNSLRGLEDSTEMPPAKLPSMPRVDMKMPNKVGMDDPAYVPNSLRGLESSNLPAAKLPSIDIKRNSSIKGGDLDEPIYVPNSLRGLESSDLPSAKLPSIDIKRTSKSGLDEPVYVPNSLRGLESTNLASGGVHSTPINNFDLHSELRAKPQGGFFYKLTHMFDRAPARDSTSITQLRGEETEVDRYARANSPSGSRVDKLNASARDFWDLRGQDSPKESFIRPASPITPAQSLANTLRDGRSPSFDRSPVGSFGIRQDWDIMHDRQFEELMAETME